MAWEKLGRIFEVKENYSWMNSHTTPIAAIELNNCIRIFFSTRAKADSDGAFVSNSSYVDVEKGNPTKIIAINDKPLFELGGYGYFDEFGVMVTDVKKIDERILLYYAGWQRLGGRTAAYQVMLGLGISDDNGDTFRKYSNGPIMGIDTFDHVSIGNVAVLDDAGIKRMYYTSLTEWQISGKKPTYEYVINYAESKDGILWNKSNRTVVGIKNNFGVATPTVVRINDKYHMWFGFRKGYDENLNVGGYLIGYAYSTDGVNWTRDDSLAGIDLSISGWDSKMICYPSVLRLKDYLLMFYCGNDFGKDGFGVAVKPL